MIFHEGGIRRAESCSCIRSPLETDALVAVLALVAVELEVVVEDEAVLHVAGHLDPDGGRS